MKKKNIFIVVIIIILLVVAAILMLSNKKDIDIEPKESFIPDDSQKEKKESDVLKKQNKEKVADSLVVFQKQLENKARFFIERYNTYSSDNNQENLRSLLPQVSAKLAKEIETRLMGENNQNDTFFSLQTKVLSLDLLDFIDNEKAVFEGQIQAQETKGEITEIHYKTVILKFIYENTGWKVDGIEIK